MIDDPLGPIEIRVGTEADGEAILAFALSLAEDAVSSRDKWLQLINQDHIHPLIATYKENIVGKIQARLTNGIGWLENARVRLDFRRVGIAHTLVDAAMDWLISQGVTEIRTVVDADNMAARKIVERHHFKPKFLAIGPTTEVTDDDADPMTTSDVAPVLDEAVFSHFFKLTNILNGNVMVNGQYVPFSQQLFNQLIQEHRLYTNYEQTMLLILSSHKLPSEYHGFVVGSIQQDYFTAGKVVRGFAARELATLAVCHAPARKEAMVGLAKMDYGWHQPHSLIIYSRDSWQERDEE